MYFKSIELVGFKSFAERTVIGFEPGITAIVGPNGCGKSNVSDAIRWVLGEQNARTLRGSVMEDLIFGGTAQEEPKGMAEVSLTLGDARGLTDDQRREVTVSRRLFRSGESQYFLNKQPCRLRDIHDVFMDTGLGTHSYSYIEQGNIDLILSSKPEDRRFLFDETAGITKYKAHKKEALRKLEGTEANLLRLSDLIREVKRQIISIQRQAGKARRYKEIADELQRLEVGLLLHKRARFAAEMKVLEKKRGDVETVLSRLNGEMEERETRVRDIRAELRSSELRHEELQSRKLDLLRKIDRESGNISLHEQRIADTNSLAQNLSEEIKGMRQKAAALESAIREKQESLQNLCQQRSGCDQRLKEGEKGLEERLTELRKCEAHTAELSGRLLDLIRRESETRSKLLLGNERLQEHQQTLSKLRGQREQILQSLGQKEGAREAGSRSKDDLSVRVRQEKEKLSDLRTSLEDAEGELQEVRQEIIRTESAISCVASERRFLTDAVERYEGYNAGVRAVMEEARKEGSELTGIVGTVADVIEAAGDHERSVELALEGRVQWVLTETLDDTKKAAAYLIEKARGTATFLPLEMVKGSNGRREAVRRFCEQRGSSVAPVVNAVSYEPRYAKLVEWLLGDVVVVRDFDQAVKLALEDEEGLTFVSQSGEKIATGPAITVGNRSTETPGLVSRKSRIASLAREEQALEAQLEKSRGREGELLRLQKDLAIRVEEQMALSTQAMERVVEAEKSLFDLSATIESLRNRAEELASHAAQTESDLRRLEDERKALAEGLRMVTEERSETEKAISCARQTVEGAQEDVASVKKDVADLSLAKASFDERIANLQADIEYVRGQSDFTQKGLESRVRQVEQGKTYIGKLEGEVQECRSAIASLNREKDEVAAAIEKLDERRKHLVDGMTQVEWEIKEKSNAAREKEKEVGDLNVRLTEVRLSVTGIDDRLATEYGLCHDDPKATSLPDDTDWQQVQSTVAELKGKLQSMGPVNLCAIEEHDALQQRYEQLTTQQADMIEARDSLLKAIAKLDRESKTLFREAFERIREEFQKMFERLFGGGRADLVLVDESNLLESGIEIIARPPGKKLQSISLLSGGERAMTAISLLFAIFKVKPSPFCILDEIDAPLDDSNIGRFAEILREFAQNSQFIIITHNKRTISASDVLYGITMQESGKSKVVSARLTRGREKAAASGERASSEPRDANAALVPASN